MGIIHIPRTAAAIFKGYVKRRLCPIPENERALIGIGFKQPPHVYTSRAGAFDVDLMMHMNNASYLTHAELARWEWTSFGGTLAANIKSKSYFIVSASMIRFRKEVKPLAKFQIETRLGSIDERNVWVYQTFHYPENELNSNENATTTNGSGRGKVLAQVLTQGVITNKGKVINPRTWLEDHFPTTNEIIDDLLTSSPTPGDEKDLFDDKATRFLHLEDAMRKSAANQDSKVSPK
ncbi:hypothetical protein ACHAXS_002780 [Conticribra weissflogii]